MKIILYLDPGSGSILLQLILAGAAAIGIALSAYWKRIRRIFTRKDEQEADQE
jgi:hypothetical protein